MLPFTLSGRVFAAVVLGFSLAASAADQPNKTNDKGKDDKKDTKSTSDGKGASAPARDSAPANKNEPNGAVQNKNVPNGGYTPMVPNAQAPQGVRRLLGGNGGNEWRTQWEREQWLREQQRQLDQQRERDLDARDRDLRNRERDKQYDSRSSVPSDIPRPTDNSLRGSGSVVSTQSGQLVVKIDGDVVRVQRNADSKIEVLGAAEAGALQAGRIVRIEGSFESTGDKLMRATKPILAVDIVTPRPGSVPGTMTPLPGDEAQINGQDPAAGPNAVRSLSVIGRVLKFAQGELTLDLAGTTLKATLDPAATVSVRGSDISLAHAGDPVDVVGYYLKPGYAMGQEIKITLANPLGTPANDFTKQKPAVRPAADVVAPVAAKPAGG